MPPPGARAIMDITGNSHGQTKGNQVTSVNQLASGGYRVTVTDTELALIQSALQEAERVTRFGIEVLDEADRTQNGEQSADSPLLREIDALAMREASLRSLQKMMAEVDFTRTGW